MAKPRFEAARELHVGGFGTASDGSDVVKLFAEGDVVPNAAEIPTLLGLVVNGSLRPANREAEDLVAQLEAEG